MKNIALVIGHDPKEHGAVGVAKSSTGETIQISEYAFNAQLSGLIRERFALLGYKLCDVRRHIAGGYSQLPAYINNLDPLFAVELHFNSASIPTANGCEMLHHHNSFKGAIVAQIFQETFTSRLSLRNRGIKPTSRGGRGYPFLAKTKCPAIIAEPFFGSNSTEMQYALDHISDLADAYVSSILQSTNALQ
jgi:N-acetylmuramoyl-L-alanine amidase